MISHRFVLGASFVLSLSACDAPPSTDAGSDASRDASRDGSRDASIDALAVGDGGTDAATIDAFAVDAGTDAFVEGDAGSDAGPMALCPASPPIVEPTERLYVAPDGNDAAAGTMAAPLASLSAAASRFPMGGTIIVRGGAYGPQHFGGHGMTGHPLVVRAADGETPVFSGTGLTAMYSAVFQLSAAQHVVIEGLEIGHCTASQCAAIQGPAVTDLAIVDCELHDLDGTAARFSGSTIRFEGNHIHDVALANVNNTAFPNGGWPTCMGTLPNNGTPTTPQADGVIIRNNVIEDCWGEGIGIWYGTNVLVEGNVVDNPFSVGIYMDNASHVTVTRNFVRVTRGIHGSHGTGVMLATEHYSTWSVIPTTDLTITNNVIVGGAGIGWFSSPETSAANTYARITLAHDTVIATSGAALQFQAVGSGMPIPTGCTATNDVFAETSNASLGNASGWTLTSNAWLGTRPPAAGASDVAVSVNVPTVTMPIDVEGFAAAVGDGVAGTGVMIDYACNARDASMPVRGAFER